MILFWTLNEDEYDNQTYEVKVSSSRTLTRPEQIVNHLVTVLFLLSFLISTSLNPLLIYHHQSTKKQGITTFLFIGLALSDFLTNIFSPLVHAFHFSSQQIFSLGSPVVVTFGVFSCITECYSQCSTALLAVTRFLKIVCPFIRLKKKTIAAYLGVYTLIMTINNILLASTFHIDNENVSYTSLPFQVLRGLCFWLKVSHCVLGVIFSILTVIYVYCFKPPSQTDHVTKGVCEVILMMNFIYSFTIISALINLIPFFRGSFVSGTGMFYFGMYGMFLNFYFVSVVTAAWNPFVMLMYSRPIRQTFISLVSKLKVATAPEATKQGELQVATTSAL